MAKKAPNARKDFVGCNYVPEQGPIPLPPSLLPRSTHTSPTMPGCGWTRYGVSTYQKVTEPTKKMISSLEKAMMSMAGGRK